MTTPFVHQHHLKLSRLINVNSERLFHVEGMLSAIMHAHCIACDCVIARYEEEEER